MIRITGGINRSRLLQTPDTELTKPTMDKVRLGVFSALGYKIENAEVMDLFAGSGSYGFEALSRGAKFATFIDESMLAFNTLKINKNILGINNCEIIYKDSLSYLKECNKKFDIIFVDPPYKLNVYTEIMNLIYKNNLLNDNGVIVLESENEIDLSQFSLSSIKFYKYGLAKIYIIKK